MYDNGIVKLWLVKTGVELNTLNFNHLPVIASNNENVLVVGNQKSLGMEIHLFYINSGELAEASPSLKLTSEVLSLAFVNETVLIYATNNGHIKLWDIYTREELITLRAPTKYYRVYSLAFDGSNMLAVGSGEGKINLWDVNNGTELGTLYGHKKGIQSLVFSPSNVLASLDYSFIKIWSQ